MHVTLEVKNSFYSSKALEGCAGSPADSAVGSVPTHALAVSSLGGPSVIEAENTLEPTNSILSQSKHLTEPASIRVPLHELPKAGSKPCSSVGAQLHLLRTKRDRDSGKPRMMHLLMTSLVQACRSPSRVPNYASVGF